MCDLNTVKVSGLTKNIDEQYMQRCLQLASQGLGSVSTNPMVGCVIVYKGKIVGEGYHQRFGEAHAEVNAISSVNDKNILSQCTLYVNLEPCAHYGKTPPCADLIAKYKMSKVVIGTIDTFSEVAGKGIEKLKSIGIDVKVGVLEEECRNLNKRFFCFNEKERPYIILKWAQTADGFIGRKSEGLNKRISNAYADIKVHKWRTEEDAIMVGTTTTLDDNPTLTARHWEGRNPVRILIDFDLKVPVSHNLYNSDAKTIIINAEKAEQVGSVFYEKNTDRSLDAIINIIAKHKIQSVIVEGGAKLLQSFINEGLWDEIRIIKSATKWMEGVKAPSCIANTVSKEIIEGDTIYTVLPFSQ